MKTIALIRCLAIGLMILFAVAFVVPGVARGDTIYVDDDNTSGPWDGTLEHPYQHIQDGIDNASSGDTVYVFNGIYEENVEIYTTISLMGEDKDSTIIDGVSYNDVIYIYCTDSVTISGFTLQRWHGHGYGGGIFQYHSDYDTFQNGLGYGAGIFQYYSDYNTFSGNKIVNNSLGIFVKLGSNTTISGNEITDNSTYGILSAGTSFDLISGNTIANSGYGFGLELDYPHNSTITNNSISGGIYIYAPSLSMWNTHTIENNYADGKPIYYYKNDSSSVTVPSDAGEVILANCTNFTVEGLNISDVVTGVLLGFSSDNNITGNTITGTKLHGIKLWRSSDNNITGNTITNSGGRGILLMDSCAHNTICENTVTGCGEGIVFDAFSGWPEPIDNMIYHNNLINNYANAVARGTNLWDDGYPSGGNYWSDFDEPGEGAFDNNGDGIVDSAYNFPYDSKDRYPLMNPWDGTPPTPNCGDASGNGIVDVGDIIYLINYLYINGPEPWPALCVGDCNNDDTVDSGDVVQLLGYVFAGASAPSGCCGT